MQCGNEQYMGYSLDQFKALLLMDSDFKRLDIESRIKDEKIANLHQQNANTELINKKSEFQLKVVEEDRQRLYKEWNAENEKRRNAEERPTLSITFLGWGIAVAEAVGIALAVALSK